MSCVKPLIAFRGVGGAIVFDKNKSLSRTSFMLPCGRCIGCRMEYARQWGIRCLHEKKMWPSSCYVTLTYNDEFLPTAGSLSLRDVQLFMKRLRKWREPSTVRFFLGAEYGETNGRPHYHALLFNVEFPDLILIGKNARGEPLYTSQKLVDLWSTDGRSMGHVSIGEITFDSAVYCAKYALKRVNGDRADDHYTVYDADGVCHRRSSEFAVMSRRPGIGATYYDRYGSEVRDHDSIVVNGREVRPLRFYDTRTLKLSQHDDAAVLCFCVACCNKRKRKRMAVLNKADNTPERLRVKETLMQIAAEKKERKL